MGLAKSAKMVKFFSSWPFDWTRMSKWSFGIGIYSYSDPHTCIFLVYVILHLQHYNLLTWQLAQVIYEWLQLERTCTFNITYKFSVRNLRQLQSDSTNSALNDSIQASRTSKLTIWKLWLPNRLHWINLSEFDEPVSPRVKGSRQISFSKLDGGENSSVLGRNKSNSSWMTLNF